MFGQQKNDHANGDAAIDPQADAALAAHQPETVSPSSPPTPPATGYGTTDLPHVTAPAKAAPTGTPAFSTPATPAADDAGIPGDLIDLKQSVLQELTPLVGHLEQTPEEKFRTTMMMIQASDDQSLLPAAFSAAKEIKDEKARAQALLDVVNEINYFAQQHSEAA